MSKAQSVSAVLETLVAQHTEARVSFNAIRNSLDGQGFCLLMIILAFPAALPLPYPPGFTTIIGIPLGLFALQMLLGFSMPWLPVWVGNKTIERTLLVAMVKRAVPLLRCVERYIKPRFGFADTAIGERLVGLGCLICAVLISIPVPFGHMLPGVAVLLMSLGLLDKDGVTIIIGMIVALLGVAFDAVIIFAGAEAILEVFSFIEHHPIPIHKN